MSSQSISAFSRRSARARFAPQQLRTEAAGQLRADLLDRARATHSRASARVPRRGRALQRRGVAHRAPEQLQRAMQHLPAHARIDAGPRLRPAARRNRSSAKPRNGHSDCSSSSRVPPRERLAGGHAGPRSSRQASSGGACAASQRLQVEDAVRAACP